jgi:signal transduction histidine kinase
MWYYYSQLNSSIFSPENLKANISRIAQEALNNIAKHSKAEWVDISPLYVTK